MPKVKEGINDLKTLYPDIAAELHPTKNGELTPSRIAGKSHQIVWWVCDKGHEWDAMVSNRTGLGRGCPYCTGQKVLIGYNDLATINPSLASEWNTEKNGDLKPTDVTVGSKKEVWWKCAEGHEWKAIIKSRNYYGTKCPYCPNTSTIIVTKGINDFASRYPEHAKYWHPTKNGDLTAADVSFGSGKKVWWLCKNGHEYKMTIYDKSKGKGCPVCLRRRRTSFPEQAFFYYIRQAYPDAINSYRDIFDHGMELDIYIPSIKLGIEYDGKAFHKNITNMIRDSRKYQICKNNNIQLIRIVDAMDSSILTRYDRVIRIVNESNRYLQSAIIELLFHLGKISEIDVNLKRDRLKILEYLESLDVSLESEYPEIAKEFHPTKNGSLLASYFHPGSNEKVWWKCSNCNHDWLAAISDRTGPDKNGCPVCSKKIGSKKRINTYIEQKGSLAETHPDILSMWDYEKNAVLPTEVTAGSGKKVWWKCDLGHSWESLIDHVTRRNQKCPYCQNKRVLHGFNDLATVNPSLANEWHYDKNGALKPTMVVAGSGKKVWWKCSVCSHEWQATVASRNSGNGCAKCAAKRMEGNKHALKKV